MRTRREAPAIVPSGAWTGSFLAVLALAAAGFGVIVLSGSLGAATSGHGFWSHWLGPSSALTREGSLGHRKSGKSAMGGQSSSDLTRSSDLPGTLERSGA